MDDQTKKHSAMEQYALWVYLKKLRKSYYWNCRNSPDQTAEQILYRSHEYVMGYQKKLRKKRPWKVALMTELYTPMLEKYGLLDYALHGHVSSRFLPPTDVKHAFYMLSSSLNYDYEWGEFGLVSARDGLLVMVCMDLASQVCIWTFYQPQSMEKFHDFVLEWTSDLCNNWDCKRINIAPAGRRIPKEKLVRWMQQRGIAIEVDEALNSGP